MHFGPLVPNFQRKNGEIGAWTTDSRGRQKAGPPPFVRDLIRDAKALRAIPAMASVTDDTACSFVQRYEPGQGGLKPHFDHRWMFQEAILSLSLEGEGLLRMHRGGRVKSVTLARGTLFVMTGDARHEWKHELPPSGVAARRTSLIVRPVERGYLKKKGRAPFSYE